MESRMNPKISIVTVTFNCATVIEDNIKSTLNEPDTEVIIVDNNSQDNTVKIIEPYVGDRLKLIVNETNKGFTEGNNIGIRAAKGQFILLLNPDARLISGVIHEMVDFLNKNSKVGALAPSLLFPDGSPQNYTRRFPKPLALWVESFVPKKWWNIFPSYKKYTYQDLVFGKAIAVEQPAGAALMFRNQWLLDEYYFNYVSDVDLCKTIISDGYSIIQLANLHFFHHQSKGGTEDSGIRIILDLDNYYGMRYYFKKHNQLFNLLMYVVLFGTSLFLRWCLSLLMANKQSKERWFKLKHFILNKDIKQLYACK